MKTKGKKIIRRNKKDKTNRGITLISLVVTIIILLILAGVAINLGIKDGGIFDRAQNATLTYDVERAKKEIEIVKGNVLIDNKGKINKDDFFDGLIEEGIVESEDKIIDNGDGTYDITTKDDYVFEVEIKEDGNIDIDYIGKEDNLGPRIRGFRSVNSDSNSIEVEVKVDYAEGAEYTYLYKKANEEEYKEAEKGKDILEYKYEGLSQEQIYKLKVIIKNKKGTDEREISVATKEITKASIEVSGDAAWENGQAKIEVSTNEEGYKLEYQINGTEGSWIEVGEDGIIGNLNNEDNVYIRLNDGVNQSDYASVKIEDNKKPNISIGSITSTSNSITVTINAIDNETGIKEEKGYIYYVNGEQKGESDSNSYTISGLADGESYKVKVEVVDKAGNTNSVEQSIETKTVPAGTTSGAITFTNPVWSGATASIKVSTNTGYQIEYQKNSHTGSWTKIASGGTISGLSHNTTVYARLTDGINAGDYATASIKDTVEPTVTVKSSNVTYNSATLTATASDAQSGINNYKFYLGSTLKSTQAGNSFNYTGLAENTTYTLKVIVTDKAGNTKEASTSIKTGISNVAPQIASVTYSTKTTNSLSIKARATDGNSGDKLTYTLYTSTSQSSGFTSKATVSNQAPGTEVSLTATGLSQYTYYYYYVTVSDGKANVQSATQPQIRTYCPGNINYCRGGDRCDSGKDYICTPSIKCSGGIKGNPCEHGQEIGHYYCPHGRSGYHRVYQECPHGYTSSHTEPCSHGKSSSHYYCSHSNRGKQHD